MRLIPALAAATTVLMGCAGRVAPQGDELFVEKSMHRMDIGAAPSRVCDAVTKVLLGEGYVVARATPEDSLTLVGTREFMAEEDHPAVLQFHASCLQSGTGTSLFATVVESRFVVSQTKQKTSVGIPIVAPVSVATTTTSDALVKVSGETLRDAGAYQRFFAAVAREMGAGK
jgi:hypothetical protein